MSDTPYRLIAPTTIDGARDVGERVVEPRNIEKGFNSQLGRAIDELDKLHLDADKQADAIASGGGNLHEVALAFEKADLALRLATRVRNKVVDVYNEIMRMSV